MIRGELLSDRKPKIPGIISVGPEFDYRLLAALGFGSMEANFTYGAVIDVSFVLFQNG